MEKTAQELVPGDVLLNVFDVEHEVRRVKVFKTAKAWSKRTGGHVPLVAVTVEPRGDTMFWAADRPIRLKEK